MTILVKEIKNPVLKRVRPPLLWEPVQGTETTDFIRRKNAVSKIPMPALQGVVFEAQQVLGRCVNPNSTADGATGLVVGFVQSGKTISFTTLSALAHDNGYGLIILIAGTLQNLLLQTKKRLEDDLNLNGTGATRPWSVVDSPGPNTPEAQNLTRHLRNWLNPDFPQNKRRVCFVIVLKQHQRLANLVNCLKGLDLSKIPALVIDDESDQASLNTFTAQNRVKGTQRRSSNYREVTALKAVLPHHTYVQYTATPQANLLTDLDDALSPGFGELLKPGDGYVGGATLFKPHGKYAVTIPDSEAIATPVNSVGPPASLVNAIRIFLLGACAAEVHDAKANRTMMVHPSQSTGQHNYYLQWISTLIEHWQSLIINQAINSDLIEGFIPAYANLIETVGSELPSFEQLTEKLPVVLQTLSVREVNSTPGGTAAITWNDSDYWILVGGAKLDRGFTVEGLTVTYMPRPLASGNADNLQQRARFYGYKQKYLGYCRVYLRADVRVAFEQYVEHENAIHACLEATRGQPLKNWVREFKLHASMQPTRRGVIGIELIDIPAAGWYLPKALHQSQTAVQSNRTTMDRFLSLIDLQKKGMAAQTIDPARYIDKRASSAPNLLVESVPLRFAIDSLVSKFQTGNASDEDAKISLMFLLKKLVENNQQYLDVFLIGAGEKQNRSLKSDGTINQIFSGKTPAGLTDRSKLNYGGDSDFVSHDRVTLHLRKFDLRPSISSATSHADVPWFAVHIPESFRERYLLQPES